MTRAAALLLALAAPAQAQTIAVWGNGGHVLIEPGAGGAHVATVTLHNRLTWADANPVQVSLYLHGIAVEVVITHMPGDIPDVLTAIPPDGFIAIPERVAVDENSAGSVTIYRLDMMELG
jgi:hypothetical protein